MLDNYLLVVEYAEGGSLRDYLNTNSLSLNWKDKYRMALQLTSAIEYLHERKMVHKNLHSRNILVHKNSIKLADSGLSKRIKDSVQISSSSFDTIPYIDPRGINTEGIFSNAMEKYVLNEKSDIYSVGVLLWELSSRKKPFADNEYDSFLAKNIVQGLREEIIEGTPGGYFGLYSSK
jgi:serine/threonine protein kinase